MGFPRRLLYDDEGLVLDLRPHWWFLAPRVALLTLAVAAGVAVLVTEQPAWANVAGAVVVLAALVWFGLRYAVWATSHLVLTTDRLVYRHGVLTKTGIEIPLGRVNTVFYGQRLFGRVIGAGSLAIESAGEEDRQEWTDVRRPSEVQNEIYKAMEENEDRKVDRIGQSWGDGGREDRPGGGSTSVGDELAKLDELRQRGVLTDAEFEAQKARLLGAP